MVDLTLIFGPGSAGLSAKDAARRSEKRYVRSEGQLAVYEPSRNPTGHVLTAWEAFTAYGPEVLEEAVEYGSAILKQTKDSTADALRRQREKIELPHKSVGKATEIPGADVKAAEAFPSKLTLSELERIAFALGLDERMLAFRTDAGGDTKLAYRLKTLKEERSSSSPISAGTALLFAEASSIIRAQIRLQEWLYLPTEKDKFVPDSYYGHQYNPVWKIGYELAERARSVLGLGDSPIDSMRKLVEERLGIPVIQARLPNKIAGATIMTTDEDGQEARGVVLNTVGQNENVWVRRATLAHELGHLLYDPDKRLENIRVDSYRDSQRDPQKKGRTDYVEQRANAFAIAFLAPNDAIRKLAHGPVSEDAAANVMCTFGISHTAARYHIANVHYGEFEVPTNVVYAEPSDEQKAAEDFTLDQFPLHGTRDQRRGRFSGLVAEACKQGLLSEHTAALYLQCSPDDVIDNLERLQDLYPTGAAA